MSSAMKFGPVVAAAFMAAGSAMADTRPMPDYFVSSLVARSAAQALGLSCEELSVDPLAVAKAYDVLLDKLEADGFDPLAPAAEMDSGEAELTKARTAFMDKHQLEGATTEAVCAAGRSEIAERSEIGTLLIEVSE